jgi:hypothetical protein
VKGNVGELTAERCAIDREADTVEPLVHLGAARLAATTVSNPPVASTAMARGVNGARWAIKPSRPAASRLVAGAGSRTPWAIEPVEKLGSASAVPLNPNSRLGRKVSPLAQGRVKMDAIVVGIDVSKDKLDIAIRPGGEAFSRLFLINISHAGA